MPPKYKHLAPRDQILLRPGQHIGSSKTVKKELWISTIEVNDEGVEETKIVEQEVEYNPGLVHIFYEVLSNAQDNYFRSKDSETPLKKIEITLKDNQISIWNDGNHIPVTIHKWEKDEEKIAEEIYEPEIIFGYLNSSGNYDDAEGRTGAGLHGVGVKLTNIFSKSFKVECQDPENKLYFKQEYSNNMETRHPPEIKKKSGKGWTQVTYTADFERFGVTGYSTDFEKIIKKLCIDCAMITGVKIVFNDETLQAKSLMEYSKYYINSPNMLEFKSEDSTVVLCEKLHNEKSLIHFSFVNGVLTPKGGIHLDSWVKGIFKPLFDKIKKKYSGNKKSSPLKITQKNLYDYFYIFVSCNLKNPEFESQTKSSLSSPAPTVNVPDTSITKLMKWEFLQDIEETIRIQNMKELKKTDGKKVTSVDIESADDANKAGSKESEKCVLFITEGLSAKTFVVKGIGNIKNGRDYYGILPVRGKVLNVRNATGLQINNNKEITNLKKMLGLSHGMDYSKKENFKTLRYGSVNLLTDADCDGSHIKGLLINFFQLFYPSLIKEGFVTSFRTPIVKITMGKKEIDFYYMKSYKEWIKTQDKPFTAKYYKGLGTSMDSEIKKVFDNPIHSILEEDEKSNDTVDMVFGKLRANERKTWLENYTESDFEYENKNGKENVPVSSFINNELIEYVIDDNNRSIPNVVDGLKPSQRKAVWLGLKELSRTKDYKVAQFAAEVAKKAEYHHGEVSMQSLIINMAQDFVGSNNINLFEPRGQFGTRIIGGNDAASARYIYIRAGNLLRYIFRKEDDPILKYLEVEGNMVEPKYFVPVIPMVLVNGSEGIGFGYSTKILNYNPEDLVKWVKNWIENEADSETVSPNYSELIPWYSRFQGSIVKKGNSVTITGNFKEEKGGYRITELPVGVWTDKYKETLKDLKEKKMISKFTEHGTAETVDFKVFTDKKLDINKLHLIRKETTSNMSAFLPKGGLKTFKNVEEMLREYCAVRYHYYGKRKKHLIKSLNNDLLEFQTRVKFIKLVLDDVTVLKQNEENLFEYFEKQEYYKKEDSYRYLTDTPVRSFTKDKLETLNKKILELENEIDYVKNKSPKEMWLKELDDFLVEYKKNA